MAHSAPPSPWLSRLRPPASMGSIGLPGSSVVGLLVPTDGSMAASSQLPSGSPPGSLPPPAPGSAGSMAASSQLPAVSACCDSGRAAPMAPPASMLMLLTIMIRVPRRLRKLNLDVRGVGHAEVEEENWHFNCENIDGDAQSKDDDLHMHIEDHDEGNIQQQEYNVEDHPHVDNIIAELPLASRRPIKIMWPNGEVRQILGDFKVKNMEQLKQGKVIVETDENGVPNDRSGSILGSYLGQLAQNSTFAPLHIPKWDDELFVEPHKSIITDVEIKFIYPSETKHLTRDWILMKVGKGWRSYKHRLKKRYFNRDERTLNEILKDVPKGVNEYQWGALLAIWCQDQHKKLCEKNSECAKQQKNPHTTGRKSHARLCKEMEEKNKGKVHDIDVWDEAHKKKDARMKEVLETAYDELAKRKSDNYGIISSKEYDEIFRSVVGKETKLRGYYDQKNWSQIQVSQEVDDIGQSEQQEMLKGAVKAMNNKIEDMSGNMNLMQAFIERKFPGEDWRNMMLAEENNEVDTSEQVGNDIPFELEKNLDELYENVHSTPNNVQQLYSVSFTSTKRIRANPSEPHEHMIAKQSSTESFAKRSKAIQGYKESTTAHDLGTNKVDIFDQIGNDNTNGLDNNLERSYGGVHAAPNYVQPSHISKCTNAKDRHANISVPYEQTTVKQLSVESSAKRFKTSHRSVESMLPREHGTNEVYIVEQVDNNMTNRVAINLEDSHVNGNNIPNNVLNIAHCQKMIKGPQTKRVLKDSSSNADQRVVYLFSLNSIYKGKVVAKGNLVSSDSTHVVGGNMLGDEYYGVAIHGVTNIGDERLPRPFEKYCTVKDAIDCVVAWPQFYVKKA